MEGLLLRQGCYSIEPNPTIDGFKLDGTGAGVFESLLTDLTQGLPII